MITFSKNNEGEILKVAGSKYRILKSGKETENKYSVIEMIIPPGSGPIPHSHKNIQETFYIAEGKLEFQTQHNKIVANTGDFICIPLGGEIHSFKNTSDKEVKLICTVIPAGLDEMFLEVSQSGTEKAKEIGEKYGNIFYPNFFDKK